MTERKRTGLIPDDGQGGNKMPLDLTQKTQATKPWTGALIILGADVPKNWRENWAAQDDQKYQELWDKWDKETDPERKKQAWQAIKDYWAKRRVELGFTEPEEE